MAAIGKTDMFIHFIAQDIDFPIGDGLVQWRDAGHRGILIGALAYMPGQPGFQIVGTVEIGKVPETG